MTRAMCAVFVVGALALTITTANAKPRHHKHHHIHPRVTAGSEGGPVIGGRPAGCPRRYCGCGSSLYVFGEIRPELNLASNWIRHFPRTSPAPSMAAARSGHVMILKSQVSGNDWLVYDPNSGGGLTREHVRSIRGYTTVNPHGSRVAMR
jgi:hypothetical protein